MLRKLLNPFTLFRRVSPSAASDEHAAASANETADQIIAEGNRAENEGNFHEACEKYRKAVETSPEYAKAHLNLGIGLMAIGDTTGAVEAYEKALAHDPGNPYASYNLANHYYVCGALEQAEEFLHSALSRKPDFPEAQVILSNVYDSQERPEAALAVLEAVLKQRPDYSGALYNYGLILRKQRKLAEAEIALRRAIKNAPDMLSAYAVLGVVLRGLARIEESAEIFCVAQKLAPQRFDMLSEELFTLNFSEDVSNEVLFDRHRIFGARVESVHTPRFGPHRNARNPGRRLRVGYISGDFYRHPVALFLIPLLERHDSSSYETYCYSTGTIDDEVTRQIQGLANVWCHATPMSDTELADTINKDGIDILVDLSGHSGAVRLGVFAQQPAPVQVTWLGYLNTTGMSRMQYRLCDRYSDPPGLSDRFHTEILYRLPNSQWCYRPFVSIEPSEEPPFSRNGFITFGSFNHMAKLSKTLRKLWGEILRRVPSSKLILVGIPDGSARDDLLQDLGDAGVMATRVKIVPHVSLDEYYRWFNSVDIALDTTPYSGGTTTCDTLWMGVPVITMSGSRSMSRSAASILSTVGLPEWIASSPEDYIRMAVEFAREEALIASLRKSLRQTMRDSPLMDEVRFARDMEEAYRHMWCAWCGQSGADLNG